MRFRYIKNIFNRPRTKRGIISRGLIGLIIVSSAYLFIVNRAYGVTRTWDGGCGVDTSWSCSANWSSDTQPGASDLALFDTFDGNADIDATYAGSVGGVQITASYDGTITQSRSLTIGSQNFNQAGGTWTGGAQTLDINDGSFTVSGGVHTATTGTWTLERNLTYSGGTLTMTGATVTLDGSTSDSSTVTCTGSLGGTVNSSKTDPSSGSINVIIASDCTVTVGSLSVDLDGGTVTINGTMNHSGTTFDISDGSFEVGASGVVTYSGTDIHIDANLTQNGTWDLTGKTIYLDAGAGAGNDSSIVTCSSLGGTLNIDKPDPSSGSPNVTISSGCTVTVGSLSADLDGGTVTIDGTMNHTGSTFNIDDGSLTVSSTGTITYSGTDITLERDLTIASGATWNLSGKTITLDGGAIGDSSTVTCTGSLGGTLNLANPDPASGNMNVIIATGCTVTVGSINSDLDFGTITINGTMNHTGTTFNIDNGNFVVSSTGTVTYSGTDVSIAGSLSQGGVWNVAGKTITFDGIFAEDDTTLTCTGTFAPGSLVLAKTADGDFTLATGCTTTIDSTDTATNVGDITVNGNLTINNTTTDTLPMGNSGIDLTNNGTLTIGSNVTLDMGNDIDNNGALTVNGGLKTDLNLDSTGGTIVGSGIITFEAATVATNLDSILTCSGTINPLINVVKIENGQDFTLSSGCTVTLSSGLATVGSIINNGTINGSNLSINENLNTSSGTVILSGTLTFNAVDVATNNDSTLTCGSSPITGNITINKTTTGQVTVIASDCTITGNFTRTDGEFNNPSSSYSLTIQGNFSMSTTDVFGGNNLILVLSGSSDQTMTQNAGAINNNIQINKSSGTASLSTNLITNGVATVSAGTLDLNSRNFTAGQGFLVNDGGTLELYGSETTTSPTLNTGSTVKYTGDSGADVDAYTLKDLSYYHLTIASVDSGDTYATPNATEDVDGNFTVSGGVFTAPSSTFTIGGNFTHSGGTFTHNSGTVTFDTASQTSNISGNTTFNNLSSTTAGKQITVANGSTQTVAGTFTLTGSAGSRIRLTSVAGGSQWDIVATGQSVSYVEARDSDACGGTSITATYSINLGNNTCWSFYSGANPPQEVKVQRGVNIRRGTTIQRN